MTIPVTSPTRAEIRRFRADLSWTQQDLADSLGVAMDTMRRWENGYSRPPAYLRLALEKLRDLAASEIRRAA